MKSKTTVVIMEINLLASSSEAHEEHAYQKKINDVAKCGGLSKYAWYIDIS